MYVSACGFSLVLDGWYGNSYSDEFWAIYISYLGFLSGNFFMFVCVHHIYALVFEMLFLIWNVVNIFCGFPPYFDVSHQEYHGLLE